MRIEAYLMSCPEREPTLLQTLSSLANAGWPEEPTIVLDDGTHRRPLERIQATWRRMISRASESGAEFVLLLEDDIVFGKWFTHNLVRWRLLQNVPHGTAFYASLYNPGHPYMARNEPENYLVADPRWAWGSQALVMSIAMVRYVDRNWDTMEGNPDIRMPLLARVVTPIYYHEPSLVDHSPAPTTWGGIVHSAVHFDPEWRVAPTLD